ncbi:hypothetical protein SBV1_1530010 [Verrucomicrobia bacterium]|nr:hypothetical protein SBV1_1530010 [Verrucomicrobiota bacterium]
MGARTAPTVPRTPKASASRLRKVSRAGAFGGADVPYLAGLLLAGQRDGFGAEQHLLLRGGIFGDMLGFVAAAVGGFTTGFAHSTTSGLVFALRWLRIFGLNGSNHASKAQDGKGKLFHIGDYCS